jgi:RNA recognition motif-containing protein
MAEETKNTTVYFGGLVLECTNEDLSALLEGYNATEINVMLGRNGQSRGYALVTFATEDAASNAIVGINGVDFQGLKLELRMARLADGTDESAAEAAPAETAPAEAAPAEAAPAEAAPAEAAYFVGDRANWSKTPFQVALNYGRDADAHNTRTRIRITPDAEFLLTTTTEKDGSETTIQKVKGTSIWPGSGLTLTIMVENVSGE